MLLATYEMPRHLELVLAGLSRQTTRNFELYLCDDGSSESTRQVARQSGLSMVHLWQPNRGFRKCGILNEAIRRSQAELLIFLDGDCVPHKNFVEDHIRFFKPGFYSCGRRAELGEEFSEKIDSDFVKSGGFDYPSFGFARSCLRGDSHYFNRAFRVRGPTWLRNFLGMSRVDDLKGCNFSVSRQAMVAIDGFDESYEGYGREDTDVEVRLKNLGLRIQSLKGVALQFHVWHPRREFTAANEIRIQELSDSSRVLAKAGLRAHRDVEIVEKTF